jgi:biotin carboxyl carrier protein
MLVLSGDFVMKKSFLIILGSIVALVAADGLVMWNFYLRGKLAAKKEEKKEEPRVEHEEEGNVVKIDDETCISLGIKWRKATLGTIQPEVTAFGRLVEDPTQTFTLRAPMAGVVCCPNESDWPSFGATLARNATVATLKPRYTPTDLVDLRNKLTTAQGAVKAAHAKLLVARAARQRNESLRPEGIVQEQTVAESIAKETEEEANFRAAEDAKNLYEAALAATANTKDQLPLTLAKSGEVVDVLVQPGEAVESGQPILKLQRFDRALARVEAPVGQRFPKDVQTARITLVGHEDSFLQGSRVARATIDPKTGAQAMLFALPGEPHLRPGMPVLARLEVPGEPRKGFIIPSSAIVRYAGATWVYLKQEEELAAKPEDKAREEKGRQIVIRTEAPDLPPEQVTSLVTAAIEKAAGAVGQLDSQRSESTKGLSVVTLTVPEGTDVAQARERVADALGRVTGWPQAAKKPTLDPPAEKPPHQNEFLRQQVTLEAMTRDGWLVTSGIDKKDKPVYEGAHLLLAEELKSVIPAGE